MAGRPCRNCGEPRDVHCWMGLCAPPKDRIRTSWAGLVYKPGDVKRGMSGLGGTRKGRHR